MDGMRISELSARSGVPTSTLRYYEAGGLLPAERAGNGYRVYGPTFDLTITAPPEAAHMLADLLPTTESAAR